MKNFITQTLLLLCSAYSSLAYAQCSVNGPLYATNNSQRLQTVNPTTSFVTDTGQMMVQGAGFYTSPYNGVAWTGAANDIPRSLAFSAATSTLWYSTNQGGPRYIYSMKVNNDGTYTPNREWALFKNTDGTNVSFGACQSAAVNPIDGSVWFYVTGPAAPSVEGFYRLDPNNLAAGAKPVITGLSPLVQGESDFVFDALGNIIVIKSVNPNSNTLIMYPAQYDANGVYLGVGTTGTVLANINAAGGGAASSSLVFLPDGNLMIGGGGYTFPIRGASSIYNVSTGAVTNLGANFGQAQQSNTLDMASCFSGIAPNLVVKKAGTRNCNTNTISYTITVQNTTASMVSGAILKDATPAGLTLTSGTRNGTALTTAQLTSLGTTGLPIRTTPSNTDSIMDGQSTCTIVLNYTYPAASIGLSFSNQAFVKYNGVETLNLPNDQIPSDNPATTAANDATVLNSCLACYNPANTSSAGTDTKFGITLLQRAGTDSGSWPMIRKSAYAVLESNSKGFVITRVSTAELAGITNPVEGMMVYDTTAKCLKIYSGNSWSCFSTASCP